jgi:hypothetical protein
VLDAVTFALESCAPGRHVLKLGDTFRNVADELKTKLCRVTEVNLAATAVPPLPENICWFDEILLLGVLERLPAPQTFLQELRRRMAPRGSEVIIATPNAASIGNWLIPARATICGESGGVRVGCCEGLFTFKTLRALLHQTGFEVREVRGVAVAAAPVSNSRWTGALLKLNQLLVKLLPRVFADQICVRARPATVLRQPQLKLAVKMPAMSPQMFGRIA